MRRICSTTAIGIEASVVPNTEGLQEVRVIANDFRDRPTTIVGVLTGCIMFLADLVRHLDLQLRIDLIQASSYRGPVTTPGELRITSDQVPDVPHEVLDPRTSWSDPDAYDRQASKLRGMFDKNILTIGKSASTSG